MIDTTTATGNGPTPPTPTFDVIVVGAGFAGLYALHRLRGQGLSVLVVDAADAIGGTWYWNAYPGARCDVESLDYSYTFSPELDDEWTWTERYASQPEILRYINHVADRFDLRRDIRLGVRIVSATFDESSVRWTLVSESGDWFRCTFVVFATGTLSAPIAPPFPGAEWFEGESYMTQAWPQTPVDLRGKRVAVIGTGSSGIQAVPEIARDAAHLTVLQRTPNFSIAGRNRPVTEEAMQAARADYPARRARQRRSRNGLLLDVNRRSASEMTAAEQRAELERRWEIGGVFHFTVAFLDALTDLNANAIVQDFIREKVRERVLDPEIAERLCPTDHPFGGKRPCVDHGYYEAFNRDNVSLVDIRHNPIAAITPTGIELADGTRHDVDVIVYAIGYDAISGALLRIEVRGREGVRLRDAWAKGPRTYLGLGIAGFPNLFTVAGPGSPAVLAMMIALAEHNVDWIADCIGHLRVRDLAEIEPTQAAQDEWTDLVERLAGSSSVFGAVDSYYVGANVPGKPRAFAIYVGGLDRYRRICDDAAVEGYKGFETRPSRGSVPSENDRGQMLPQGSR